MKVILLGTGDIALKVLEKIHKDSRIELLGVICDEAAPLEKSEAFRSQVKENSIKILSFEERNLKQADIIFACEYNRIIPKPLTDHYIILNCHAGILPKYRGLSANAWAIMNGEKYIGYTIHQVDDKLDNGHIFYIGKFSISKNETYADLYHTIFQDMIDRICDILVGVHEKDIQPVEQKERGLYCSRFFSEMGNLEDFGATSDYIVNLHRCMAKPHGSGVYFIHKGKKYYVGKVISGADLQIDDYLGISGKVVNCEDQAIWVKTQDNVVILSEIETETGNKIEEGYFTIGNKFGK